MHSLRSGAVAAVRMVHSSTEVGPKVRNFIPHGCLFAPLQNGQKICYPHPLDDNADYKKFLKEDLLEECSSFLHEIPGYYRDCMVRMVEYTTPSFSTCWTFGPELIYRYAAPKEHQTTENLWKCRILRACIDLKFSWSSVFDDIADQSDMRLGKPTWKMVSRAGISSCIWEGMLLDTFAYLLVKKHFRESPGYPVMLETLSTGSFDLIIGQSFLDTYAESCKGDSYKSVSSEMIRTFKTGRFFAMEPVLGMLHAGILDEETLKKVANIFCELGKLIQIWDDFCDYYCTSSRSGKPSCDLKNAENTWVSTTAMEHFSEAEKSEFNECYGSEEPEKLEVVRRLYDGIDVPNLYIDYAKKRYVMCVKMIEDLKHKGVKEGCYSWLNWLLGNVMEC